MSGHRDIATFRRLYDKVERLNGGTFHTNDWDAFAAVLSRKRHHTGKTYATRIGQDNSNTRHYLGRMPRKTKVASKKEAMVYDSIKLWWALTTPEIFQDYQNRFTAIFK